MAVDDVAPHYQLVVDRTHEFPTLEVQVEPTEGVARRWGGFDADAAGGDRPCPRASPSGCGAISASIRRSRSSRPRPFARSEGKAVRVIERQAPA